MMTGEIAEEIRAWRAAFREHVAHLDTCPTCRLWPGERLAAAGYEAAYNRLGREPRISEWELPQRPCDEHARLFARRMRLREEMTAAARALGFNSATAYQRVYGKVT